VTENTSIKINNTVLKKLHKVKGWYQFKTGKPISLNEAVDRLCTKKLAEVEK
jgi:hypothetical protein